METNLLLISGEKNLKFFQKCQSNFIAFSINFDLWNLLSKILNTQNIRKILLFKMYRDLLQCIEENISHKLLKNHVNKIFKKRFKNLI